MPNVTSVAGGLCLCLIAGCFPIELDLNDKGEVLIARQEGFFIYNPATRKAVALAGAGAARPAFARFATGGKEALLISDTGQNRFRFDLTPLAGGAARTIYEGENTAYTLFSPDGTVLATTRLTDKERKDQPNSKIPELILLQPKDGTHATLLDNVLVAFRWFRDSERLLLFKIHSVSKNNDVTGELIELNVKNRQQTPLAAAVTTQRLCLELSPDNQRVLFTAVVAGKVGEKLEMPKENFPAAKMYEWNAQTMEARVFSHTAQFARYSPSGKRVLLAHHPVLEEAQFMVADSAGKEVTRIASDGSLSVGTDPALPVPPACCSRKPAWCAGCPTRRRCSQ